MDWRHFATREHAKQIEHPDSPRSFAIAVKFVINNMAPHAIKACVPREHHERVDREWAIASNVPNSPHYKLRTYVDDQIVAVLREADNYFDAPVQRRLTWLEHWLTGVEQGIESHMRRQR